MTEALAVSIERDVPPATAATSFPVSADAGSRGETIVRKRIASGRGCGFIVNVN